MKAYRREFPTRVKDLVDILLLEDLGLGEPQTVVAEIQRVFSSRGTHPIPRTVPEPPRDWRRAFEAEALRTGLGPVSLEMADSRLERLWNDLGLKES